jgi:hypothetical protein
LKEPIVQDGSKPVEAVQWLQRAFSIADQLEDTTAPAVSGLKVSYLHKITNFYF